MTSIKDTNLFSHLSAAAAKSAGLQCSVTDLGYITSLTKLETLGAEVRQYADEEDNRVFRLKRPAIEALARKASDKRPRLDEIMKEIGKMAVELVGSNAGDVATVTGIARSVKKIKSKIAADKKVQDEADMKKALDEALAPIKGSEHYDAVKLRVKVVVEKAVALATIVRDAEE